MATTQEQIHTDPDVLALSEATEELEIVVGLDPVLQEALDKVRDINVQISALELSELEDLLPELTPLIDAARSAREDLGELWDRFTNISNNLEVSIAPDGALRDIFDSIQSLLQEPILFCDTYPEFAASGDAEINMVFGLPKFSYNVECSGIHLEVPNLTGSLQLILPIIQLADCILKIIKIIEAIPDLIGPPPDPAPFFSALEELTDCIDLFLSFSVIGAIPDFCKFIRDVINFAIAVIECIIVLMQVTIDNEAEVEILEASLDIRLSNMGSCLRVHNDGLKLELDFKINTLELLIGVINIVLGVMPPPVGGNPPLEFSSPFAVSQEGVDALEGAIAGLKAARAVFDSCSLEISLEFEV